MSDWHFARPTEKVVTQVWLFSETENKCSYQRQSCHTSSTKGVCLRHWRQRQRRRQGDQEWSLRFHPCGLKQSISDLTKVHIYWKIFQFGARCFPEDHWQQVGATRIRSFTIHGKETTCQLKQSYLEDGCAGSGCKHPIGFRTMSQRVWSVIWND